MASWACWRVSSFHCSNDYVSEWRQNPVETRCFVGDSVKVFPAYIICIGTKQSRYLFSFSLTLYGNGLGTFKTRSFGMLCHLIRAWIFCWNVSCSSLTNPGVIGTFEVVAIRCTIFLSDRVILFKTFWARVIGTFEVVAIRSTIFLSDCVILFKTFWAQLTGNVKYPPCSTNMVLSFATTIALAIPLITL